MRAALCCAAVCPPGKVSMPPPAYWLVVSITILPSSEPSCASASSLTPHGTERTTTSAPAAASAGSGTALPPTSAATCSSLPSSRENVTTTSCPAFANWRAQLLPIRPGPTIAIRISHPQCLDHRSRDLATRVLLLSCNQTPVAHHKCREQAAVDVVRAALPQRVLQPPRHPAAPHRRVGKLLLHVREAGQGHAVDQVGAVRQRRVHQRVRAMAVGGHGLLRLVEAGDGALHVVVVAERQHRRLSARDHQRVVGVPIEVGEPRRVVEERHQLR